MDIDVLIIGRGPAGLQAGIHAAKQKVSVVIDSMPQLVNCRVNSSDQENVILHILFQYWHTIQTNVEEFWSVIMTCVYGCLL